MCTAMEEACPSSSLDEVRITEDATEHRLRHAFIFYLGGGGGMRKNRETKADVLFSEEVQERFDFEYSPLVLETSSTWTTATETVLGAIML